MSNCDGCEAPSCWEQCPECAGTGIFAGAGIVSTTEPHYYNMSQPSKLPCRVCNGAGRIYCPDYEGEELT